MLDTSPSPSPRAGWRWAVLVELSVMEQRYQAVLSVVQDGWKVVDVANHITGPPTPKDEALRLGLGLGLGPARVPPRTGRSARPGRGLPPPYRGPEWPR